jgi:glucose/arabinose dehydrogenase
MNAGTDRWGGADLVVLGDDALGARLARAVAFPATPDLAPRVRARIEREDLAARRGTRPGRWSAGGLLRGWPRLGRGAVLALLALLVAAVVTAAALLGVPGIGFRTVPEVPRASIQASLEASLQTDLLRLGRPVVREEVGATSRMPFFQPGAGAGLGAPDRLLYDATLGGGMVTSLWAATPDLPATGEEGIGLLISQLRADVRTSYLEKVMDPGVTLERVTIGDGEGWWFTGARHLLVDRPDGVVEIPIRLAGDTLVWSKDGFTFRLETAAGKERAIAFAAGLEPAFDPAAVDIVLEPFATGLDQPVFATGNGTGPAWLYVVEQPGRIVRVSPAGQVADEPFLDATSLVTAGGEQGLLGLAFHPGFEQNRRFFVNYTRADDGATVISEFHAPTDEVADPASERILLVIDQPYGNHNGGMIAFDRDGMLLIGMGDGGAGGDPHGYGQARDQLLGKLLRIDVDGAEPYAIPADNPFADGTEALPEIWALGLRNPWRFSVDRATGDIWLGDVGQGSQEEIDVLPAGAGGLNLGWVLAEGSECGDPAACEAAGLTPPVVSVDHGEGVCSIIGGYVYRGSRQPGLMGGYLFSDYCRGDLWLISPAEAVAGTPVEKRLAGHHDGSITSFAEDDEGELYAVDHGGAILRVTTVPAASA